MTGTVPGKKSETSRNKSKLVSRGDIQKKGKIQTSSSTMPVAHANFQDHHLSGFVATRRFGGFLQPCNLRGKSPSNTYGHNADCLDNMFAPNPVVILVVDADTNPYDSSLRV